MAQQTVPGLMAVANANADKQLARLDAIHELAHPIRDAARALIAAAYIDGRLDALRELLPEQAA